MRLVEFAPGAVVNLFVLMGFVTLGAMVRGWALRRQRVVKSWETGLLFGLTAVVAMLVPVASKSGMIFDCRSGVIGAGALLGGPITAAVSLPLPCLYRLYLGGTGTAPGILEMVLPAVLGSILHVFLTRGDRDLTPSRIVVSSIIVGGLSNSAILLLVMLRYPAIVDEMGLPGTVLVIVNTPISMALLSLLIVTEHRHFEALAALADSERRMLHSQKMAAVGQLSRKVAHNFVNALTTVLSNAQLAKDQAENTSQVRQLMSQTIETTGRVSRLVAELLAFSSPGSLRIRRMSLSRCVGGVRDVLVETIGPEVNVTVDVDGPGDVVDIDPNRIEQAVIHMAVNAAEAISGSGRLTLRVTRVDLPARERRRLQAGIHESARHHGSFALLSVEDTGKGMDKEMLDRIFEPFFTTKPKQDHAGLGLATVYNIVHQHNGFLDVHSTPGRGSTFRVYLPIIEEADNG